MGKAARTSIEKLRPYARPVLYAYDMAERRMKHELIEAQGNVFRLLFDVDVNVELNGAGKSLAYRITDVHTVLEPDDESEFI